MNQNGSSSPQMRRSRSRSPLDNSPEGRSRDSSLNRDRQQRNQRSRSSGGGGGSGERRSRAPSDRRVYVANIPYDTKWTDIKDLFREKVGDVSYVELFEDENGKFRGCGIVELKDKASVSKAIEVLHRFEIKGRFLVVKEDFDVERDRSGRPVNRNKTGSSRDNRDSRSLSSGFGMAGGMPQFNTYGLSPQFLESLGITGPLSNRVFVANLDYKVNTKKLQEIFKLSGKVMNIELKTDKDGNSKGHGIVEFEHPVQAVQAISMFNGQKLFNRTMSVRMDKYNEELDGGIPSKLPSGLSGVGKGLGAGGSPLQMSDNRQAMGFENPGAQLATATSGINMGMNNMGGMGMGTSTASLGGMMGGTGSMGGMGGTGMTGMGGTSMGSMGGMGGMGTGMGNMGGALSNERNMLGNSLGGMGSSGGMGVGGSSGGLGMGMGGSSMMGGGLGTGMGSGLGGGMSSGMMGLGGSGSSSGLGGGLGGNSLHSDFGRSGAGESYRSPRSSDTILVQNLPPNYTWQNLRDRFRDIGNIRYTEVKGRGTAVVRFTSERDAQRAVELMHGIRIDNRPIEVRLY